MKKMKSFSGCTIKRTFERRHSVLNMVTGKPKAVRSEIVTEPCGTPLFGDIPQQTGICDSCAGGWEHPKNKFANEKEKTRAEKTAHGRPILENEKKG